MREKPFEVKKIFQPAHKRRGKKIQQRQKGSRFIEHEIIKTELNGYSVKNPADKTAHSVKSYIYLSAE